ncbi:hypothetical protein OU798_05745 [Prolixibacteraceae bacterium Z1-6]|uniref:Lipoprotein n=1 Tax=Draconibacterium aestuarii TaxID=2998507 RepID=A0A9X3J6N8_9BACT|nr:hypothetical protein [Prolixibacteraceae bacterium Z1-6]
MKNIIRLTFLVLTLGLFSCNNENTEVPIISGEISEKSAELAETEVQMEATTAEAEYEVEFFANAEVILTQWWRIGQKFGWRNSHKARYPKQCPDVTVEEGEDNGYPKTITLNYGDSTVLNNGQVLSGLIVIDISAHRSSQDYIRTVTYTDFCRDSVCLTGTSSVEVDRVDEMFRKFTSSLTFTLPDGTVVTRDSERIWQWIAGMETEEDQTDDVVTISGNEVGEMNGETWQKRIATPLKRAGGCKYIVEGIVEITLDGVLISSIDYGNGDCNNVATVTDAEGVVSEIDLTKNKMKCNKESYKNQNGSSGYQGGNGNG